MALVGRVARPHGLRGEIVVNVETDFPLERFQAGAELFVCRKGTLESVRIGTVRFHRERPIVALDGVSTVDAAGELAGTELRVPLERLMPLPDGSFYRHDLVGCRVETVGGRTIGTVVEVEGEMGGSRLVVETPDGTVLIPLAAEICPSIDTKGKRIVVDPPEGLFALNVGP